MSETKQSTKSKKKNQNLKWYILNTYSGHEKKVLVLLKEKIKANKLEEKIANIVIPTQNKIVVKEGKKRKVEEKVLPGYILVQMELDDQTLHLVKNTDGVMGFVGTERKPTPLNDKEAENILAYMKIEQPAYSTSFSVGEAVKIIDGPFKDFVGSISEINEAKGKVKVLLSVFGRETPVDLDFLQITKL